MGHLIRQPQVLAVQSMSAPASVPVGPDTGQIEPAHEAAHRIDGGPLRALPTEAEVAAVYAAAKKKGYAEGRQEGLLKGQQQGQLDGEEQCQAVWAEKQARLDELLRSVAEARLAAVNDIGSEFVPVVFAAMAKIVGKVALTPEFVLAMVKEALLKVRHAEQLLIRVHPDDVALLRADKQLAQLSVVADENVLAGCVIETDCGEIDAQLHTQLQGLKNILLEMRTS